MPAKRPATKSTAKKTTPAKPKAPAKATPKPVAKPIAAKAPAAPKAKASTKATFGARPQADDRPVKQVPAAASQMINDKVQGLIRLSKAKGYVTVQNINEVIPESATDPELIENVMNILDNLDIKILD